MRDRTRRLLRESSEVSPQILREARGRLAIFALVVAGAMAVVFGLYTVLPALGGPQLGEAAGWLDLITILGILLSIFVAVLARSSRFEAGRLLDLGLVYAVVLAALVEIGGHLGAATVTVPHSGIATICILILLIPILIPNTPVKTLLAALTVAAMGPAGVWLASLSGKVVPSRVHVFEGYYWSFICAALTLIPSIVLGKLARRAEEADELGSYHLIEKLGEGGMGEVWRGSHRLLAREAAIKVIRPEMLGGSDQDPVVQRFEREAQATASLHSPHSVKLFDFGVADDGRFFYVMELLDGFDLQTLVRDFGPQDPERVARILVHACDSLWDAHRSRYIHRDVKPANLHLCRYGHEVDFLKVLDFGLVKPIRWKQSVELTAAGSTAGTPAFMAPEMILGERELTPAVDLYALGGVAYWLLSGSRPFPYDNPMQLITAQVHENHKPVSQRSERPVPEALEAIIDTCLAKDPAARPESADALRKSLEATGLPAGWTEERARRWWDRHAPAT